MSGEAEDAYEKRYMDPGERVLFREKVVSRAAFRVSVIFAVVFGLAGVAGLASLAVPTLPTVAALGAVFGVLSLAFAALMGGLGVLFSVFRSLVTGSHLHVHFGWTKKKIPLSQIDAVRVVPIHGLRQGKVSLGLDGVVRTWVGTASSGRGVEIAYQPEGGRKHVLTIGSDDPERFVEALERSRTGEPAGRARIGEAARPAPEDDEPAAEPASRELAGRSR